MHEPTVRRTKRFRGPSIEAAVVVVLFAASFAASYMAMRGFRSAGLQPFFYQTNFEPAVMMACGRGFVTAPSATIPEALRDFLHVGRNTFDCAQLPASLPRLALTSPGNANWYYLYGTAALLWRVTGVSWTALDLVVSAFGATATVLLYGLFRLVAGRVVAAGIALLLTLSPANLTHVLSLRDFSKVPFVFGAILILAVLVTRPLRAGPTVALSALYGALVGVGYGFRADLAVMVPFGAVVVILLLPGSLKTNAARNGLSTIALLAAFFIVAAPVLNGLKSGGCQYHFALIGLTTPLTKELHLASPIYRFGDQALDTLVDLKVADYGQRVLGAPVSELCSQEYDVASGQLFWQLAGTFPADLVARAYGSVLMILRAGIAIPALLVPAPPFPSSPLIQRAYWTTNTVTAMIAPLGPLAVLAAVAMAWASSARLGLALTLFVLFLNGYPAIQFELRHWFHLRFIPWWAALLVAGQLLQGGIRDCTRAQCVRAVAGVLGVMVVLGVSLAALRLVQTRSVADLVERYRAAPTAAVEIRRAGAGALHVNWLPFDYAAPPANRGSDLLVVTLDASHCDGPASFAIRVRYDADAPSHDLSTELIVAKPKVGAEPTRLFVPVFWQGFGGRSELKFSRLEVVGAPESCVAGVARVVDRGRLPLWLQMQVPADWSRTALYQTIEPPSLVRALMRKPRV